MLKLVPFNPSWATHDTLDLHAIYRRPVRDLGTGDLARDEDGFVQWDLTTPLPIRHHMKWTSKGFEYVTLSTTQDVIDAATVVEGCDPLREPKSYLDQARDHGPWNAASYLEDMQAARAARIAEIAKRVGKYGADEAEAMEQDRDKGYVMPAALKAPPEPKRRPKKEAVPA